MKAARVTLSDRAANGVYADESGPEIERVTASHFTEPLEWIRVLLPDDQARLEAALSGSPTSSNARSSSRPAAPALRRATSPPRPRAP